jgi:hypothetical protein
VPIERRVDSRDNLVGLTVDLVADQDRDQGAIPFVDLPVHFVLAPMWNAAS